MELRLKVDEKFMNELKQQLGEQSSLAPSSTRITQDALALYNWAVSQTAKGRVILSADSNGEKPERVVMPGLTRPGT